LKKRELANEIAVEKPWIALVFFFSPNAP